MMKRGLFLAGAMLVAGTAIMIWNVLDDISAISRDYDYMMENPEPDIVLPSHDTPDVSNLLPPFNGMSTDWAGTDLEGWWRYDIPEEYKITGGCLPDVVQVYLHCLCRQKNIDYAMVLAMIEVSSGYRYDAEGGNGEMGYMQVRYGCHKDREEVKNEAALLNPYINLSVGVEYLAELSDHFIAKDEVLTAYKYGAAGAAENYFDQGIYHSDYSDIVLSVRERILKDLDARKTEAWYQAAEGGGAE